MTNAEIIFRESCELMRAGILSGSGIMGTFTDENGEEQKIELPEEIHTFAAWKQAGYIVKKGEKAIAAFPVWKYKESRRNRPEQAQTGPDAAEQADGQTDGEQARQAGRMFMKTAYFFKRAQVERITA